MARLLAPRISAAFGQPVVVENKPGQGGSLALAQVAKAAPDGLTVAIAATAAMLANGHLYRNVGFDTLKDFAPAGTVAELPMLLVAHPSMPFNTFQELVAHAKRNVGALRFGSSGIATASTQRQPLTPDIPTIAESGLPGFAASPWLGLLYPRGTPALIVSRLNAEVVKALADPEMQHKLRAMAAVPRPSSAAEMARLLEQENQTWGRIVRESGAKVD